MGRGAADTATGTEAARRQPDIQLDENRPLTITLSDGTPGRVLGYVLRDSRGKLRVVSRHSEDIELDELRSLVGEGDTGSR